MITRTSRCLITEIAYNSSIENGIVSPIDLQAMHLVWPSERYLPGYVAALKRGWSPNNLRLEAGHEELEKITADPAQFPGEMVDREAKGPPILMPDGTFVPRLPGYRRWM